MKNKKYIWTIAVNAVVTLAPNHGFSDCSLFNIIAIEGLMIFKEIAVFH